MPSKIALTCLSFSLISWICSKVIALSSDCCGCQDMQENVSDKGRGRLVPYRFSVVELVALRRLAPRPAAQRLAANRAARASRSAAARGGVVAARQPLPLNRYLVPEKRDAADKTRGRGRLRPILERTLPLLQPRLDLAQSFSASFVATAGHAELITAWAVAQTVRDRTEAPPRTALCSPNPGPTESRR